MPALFFRRAVNAALTCVPLTPPLAAKERSHSFGLPPHAKAHLDALQAHPELAGERIYQGQVFPHGKAGATPLFLYARHVQSAGSRLVASHLTYLPTGELIIEERVTSSPTYVFQRLDVVNRQTGLSGSVALDADQGQLSFESPDTARPKKEHVSAAVVAGPNLHGHILQFWDALTTGTRLPVRMVVLARMETLGFAIHRVESQAGTTAFQITPSHFLMRLLVSPLRAVFDNRTRRVVRYEGRVPPKRGTNTGLVDLDATVDYHWDTDRYR
jgi:hypothetical protein